MSGKAQSKTPYSGKHSAPAKRGPGPEKGQIDAYGDGATRGGAKSPLPPASEHGGSLKRKGKHEVTPYGGDCCKK
jgi:hypothetical protein